jgi:tRNA-specific 2-thiouridylase
MPGGVDSSVAAWLLRQQGHEVIGLFMRHGQQAKAACATPESARRKQGCCTAADAADARRVADLLGIPFYALNFEQEFARIVDYFIGQYTSGRTPNPCIVCNTWLKFGKLLEYADRIGAEFVATGHYARLAPLEDGQLALCRGRDLSKDQSYVLFGIQRQLLPRLMFPVGEYHKEEIRAIAQRLGLRVAAKRDSQEICFVPDQDHARFIRQRRGQVDTSGEIVMTDGTVVGRHAGFEQYTVGQRKGLRLAFGEPRYVVRIEPESHRVVIGTHAELARSELTAAEANWLLEGEGRGAADAKSATFSPGTCAGRAEKCGGNTADLRAEVKIRYRSRPVAASVQLLPDNRFHVCFDEPCYAIAPGQAAVCYQQDRVLGGGWIE